MIVVGVVVDNAVVVDCCLLCECWCGGCDVGVVVAAIACYVVVDVVLFATVTVPLLLFTLLLCVRIRIVVVATAYSVYAVVVLYAAVVVRIIVVCDCAVVVYYVYMLSLSLVLFILVIHVVFLFDIGTVVIASLVFTFVLFRVLVNTNNTIHTNNDTGNPTRTTTPLLTLLSTTPP